MRHFWLKFGPEGVRRVDPSRCRIIKWIVAPFHGNLPNLSNDLRILQLGRERKVDWKHFVIEKREDKNALVGNV